MTIAGRRALLTFLSPWFPGMMERAGKNRVLYRIGALLAAETVLLGEKRVPGGASCYGPPWETE